MPTDCLIHFDNNSAKVFYSGQTLSGRVELSLTESKTVRGIYVEISGKAHCHWTEGTGDTKKSYTGNESYLAERSYFAGGRDGEITIQPGQYQYNFHCNLPAGLPTSLEGDIGYIRYETRVVLDIALWPDKEFSENFSIIKPLNLNYDPTMRMPAQQEKHKVFYPCCCFCMCPSDPLHLVARIPVSGYTPGQTINVEIEVDNKSDIEADFSVQLMKVITYFIYPNSGKQRRETKKVGEKPCVGVSRPYSIQSFRAAMVIPPIPPTDVTTSNICKVHYVLRVIGVVMGCHNDPLVDIPITIGSYPVQDNLNITSYPTGGVYNFPVSLTTLPPAPITQQPLPYEPSAPVGVSETEQPLLPPQNGVTHFPPIASAAIPSAPYPVDDPPTYEQATHGNEIAGKSFRPNYPVYRRATSYSSASNENESPQPQPSTELENHQPPQP